MLDFQTYLTLFVMQLLVVFCIHVNIVYRSTFVFTFSIYKHKKGKSKAKPNK